MYGTITICIDNHIVPLVNPRLQNSYETSKMAKDLKVLAFSFIFIIIYLLHVYSFQIIKIDEILEKYLVSVASIEFSPFSLEFCFANVLETKPSLHIHRDIEREILFEGLSKLLMTYNYL